VNLSITSSKARLVNRQGRIMLYMRIVKKEIESLLVLLLHVGEQFNVS
jgi:hypothetical protein